MNEDAVFRALADASRRQLLDGLYRKNGQTLGELCEGLEMTRQAVTKHLTILEEANLVSTQRRGAREASLSQSRSDQRDRGAMDRKIRAPASRRALGSEKETRRIGS
jgi:DNA-binding transcriptional ArsR family regulator